MIARFLTPIQDHAYLLLRVVAGLMFAFHGLQKLFGVQSEFQPPVGSQLWIGGVIELGTGLAIALGVGTRWAAFMASGTMAVAYVQFHWKLQGGASLLPAVNQGEMALLYSVVFLYVATRGGRPIWSGIRGADAPSGG
jgi:putative oxidoreductase